MSRRFWVATALTIPIVILEMGRHFIPFLHDLISARTSVWLQLVLATPVVLWAGWPFFVRGWASVRTRNLNMFTLIAMGTGIAWLFSVIATIAPGIFPASFRGDAGTVDVYFEAAAVITTLVLLGQVLELRAREQTSGAIKALLDLTPKTARRITDSGADEEVSLDTVQLGDRLRVRPGEAVPVDGTVEEVAQLSMSPWSPGESMPVTKTSGDTVIGGTINGSGALIMRAEKVGRDTMLARIVAMVADAQRSRAPIQRMADKVAGIFVPAVIVVAVVAFIVWALVGPDPKLAHALIVAVAVLIIACPCALGLATPCRSWSESDAARDWACSSRTPKRSRRMEKVDTLVVDKTGTLTEGPVHRHRHHRHRRAIRRRPVAPRRRCRACLRASARPGHRRSRHRPAACPSPTSPTSTHPLAAASSAPSKGRSWSSAAPTSSTPTTSTPPNSTTVPMTCAATEPPSSTMGADGRLVGLFAIADPIKPTTPAALKALREDGIRIVMLTGDNRVTAQAVAKTLGIDQVEAEVLPDHKSDIVTKLRGEGRVVAMAGDGVNDAPALAAADVGIAMGSGTDVAMESAGVTLLKGDLTGIVRARELSEKTMRNIRQNLFFAFVYNALGIPVAAGVLYPVFGLLLSPIIAAAAMALSSVSVITNALRLRAQSID
ncbi:MAG: copper-translocating P-type ATPase [Actinomycetales bacterium]|nr:copper-translocating P-type ATPase [Actinomycetales bacterium]